MQGGNTFGTSAYCNFLNLFRKETKSVSFQRYRITSPRRGDHRDADIGKSNREYPGTDFYRNGKTFLGDGREDDVARYPENRRPTEYRAITP